MSSDRSGEDTSFERQRSAEFERQRSFDLERQRSFESRAHERSEYDQIHV